MEMSALLASAEDRVVDEAVAALERFLVHVWSADVSLLIPEPTGDVMCHRLWSDYPAPHGGYSLA